jgi:hypothetical protein
MGLDAAFCTAGWAGSLCACAGPDKKPEASETKANRIILCKYMFLPFEKVTNGECKSGGFTRNATERNMQQVPQFFISNKYAVK